MPSVGLSVTGGAGAGLSFDLGWMTARTRPPGFSDVAVLGPPVTLKPTEGIAKPREEAGDRIK